MRTRPFGLSPRTGQSPYLLITHGEGGSSIGSPGGVVDELIDVSIVGQPVVYGAAFIVLLLVVFTGDWAGSLVTVAHEGGHMIMSVVTLRGFSHFTMDDGDNAGTYVTNTGWGIGELLTRSAGYFTPPLLGLGGAAVLANGNAWGVLAVAAFLLFAAFLYARKGLANVVTLVAVAGIVVTLWLGSDLLQMVVAVGLVWLMLLGGVRSSVVMSRGTGADAWWMARNTWIPAIVWQSIWVTTALVCLYAGGRLLLVGDAWPDGVWPFDVPAEA